MDSILCILTQATAVDAAAEAGADYAEHDASAPAAERAPQEKI